MKRKKRSRLLCLMTASILAVGCVAAALMPGGTAHAVELDSICSLTVTVEPKNMEGGPVEMPEVAIDLYKVADAAQVEGHDTYSFSTEGEGQAAYAGLALNDASAREDWQELARQAAEIALGSARQPDATVEDMQNDRLTAAGLTTGLYLVVARGRGLAAEEYIVRTAGDEEDAESLLTTVAYSESYVFSYVPQLIALPTREPDEEGNISTSNAGDWDYAPSVVLKPELQERFAALAIDKTLASFEAGSPATFVFSIEASLDGRTVYSDVASLTFDGPGSKGVLLAAEFPEGAQDQYTLQQARIPVGAQVTVTEVYSGTVYEPEGGQAVQSFTASAAKPGEAGFENNTVSFRNVYDGTGKNGGSVTNQFSYSTDNGWSWTAVTGPNASVE